MSSLAVLGCMWGDEAKAKIVDFLGAGADAVVRFQGGANAGHTIVVKGEKYVFHTIPSGILYPRAVCAIGAGVVVDPFALKDEILSLMKLGIRFEDRLFIDERAGMVLPLHIGLDAGREKQLGDKKIGTTGRGIGPAYADQTARTGLRLNDLAHPKWLKERLAALYQAHGQKLTATQMKGELLKLEAVSKFLAPFLAPVDSLLREWDLEGKAILFEGAQGSLLDLVYGTYPYVTSSHTFAGGISPGCGIPPRRIDKIIGVYKAYCTRVGEGPFPTELLNETGDRIRSQGHEYGATTGRPRRIGWFDAVAAGYTAGLSGLDAIAVTLLDVLSGIPELKICTGYWRHGEKLRHLPSHPLDLAEVEPEYLTLKGWNADLGKARSLSRLPRAALDYLEAVQDLLRIRIELVSVGKERGQTIVVK
jgi:adenylosuccinate synthase